MAPIDRPENAEDTGKCLEQYHERSIGVAVFWHGWLDHAMPCADHEVFGVEAILLKVTPRGPLTCTILQPGMTL